MSGYVTEDGKAHHGNKWMPVLYASYFGILKEIAEKYGYALTIHGSLVRDFDLVAIPWIENAGSHLEMMSEMRKALGSESYDGKPFDTEEVKPFKRVAYTIGTGGGGYIDLSVILK